MTSRGVLSFKRPEGPVPYGEICRDGLILEERPGSSNTQTGRFHVVTTGLPQRLLDSVADGGDRICVDHLVNFLALFDHHEVQVYRRKRIPGDDDYG